MADLKQGDGHSEAPRGVDLLGVEEVVDAADGDRALDNADHPVGQHEEGALQGVEQGEGHKGSPGGEEGERPSL